MSGERVAIQGQVRTAVSAGLPDQVDVVVVGSGASGLLAALAARAGGANVLLLEADQLVGGTSAISGGAAWVPNHQYSYKALKTSDSRDAARTYLLGQGRDQILTPSIVDAFLDNAPAVARFVEARTHFSWLPVAWPDYTSDIPGASNFRALFPGPFDPTVLGADAAVVRPPKKSGMARNPLPLWVINGVQTVWLGGYALVGALLHGCLHEGVTVRTGARAVRLIADEEGIQGLVVAAGDGERQIRAVKGVVLATGGFEGSDDLTSKYLGAPFPIQLSPRGHEGDAVRMVEEVGGDLVALDQAWWMPGIQVPGEEMDGRPVSRLVQGERALPHTIMVNSEGARFANEAVSYDDLGAVMRTADPVTGEMPNATAWMIFDEYYHQHYSFLSAPPGGDYPPNVVRAGTLAELARKCGIDPGGLERTVAAYNPEAAHGRDPWFNRGATTFERFFGDHNPFLGRYSWNAWAPAKADRARMAFAKAVAPIAGRVMARLARAHDADRMRKIMVPALAAVMRPCLKNPATGALGPVDTPPYFAVKVQASAIGTLGGPRTDAAGRVLDVDGAVIPGLYAAGNAGGATTAGFYGGAGGTIVLGLVFGYLAGKDAAAR